MKGAFPSFPIVFYLRNGKKSDVKASKIIKKRKNNINNMKIMDENHGPSYASAKHSIDLNCAKYQFLKVIFGFGTSATTFS